LVFSHHSLIITLTYNAHCSFLRLCLKRAPGEGRGGGGTTFRASHLWPDSSSPTMQSSWVLCQTQNSFAQTHLSPSLLQPPSSLQRHLRHSPPRRGGFLIVIFSYRR
jgi:hypothetical protein